MEGDVTRIVGYGGSGENHFRRGVEVVYGIEEGVRNDKGRTHSSEPQWEKPLFGHPPCRYHAKVEAGAKWLPRH